MTDADDVAAYLQDAAHTPGGHTPAVALPRTEAEVAEVLRQAPAVLPAGAQSSLTGGATPFGEWVLSLGRMDGIVSLESDRALVQAGLALASLEQALTPRGLFYPPTPTFRGALIGGAAATNAAGAATFKYGSTRRWVRRLTVVLAGGDVLELARGEARAHPEGYFEVEAGTGDVIRVPVPGYRMPDVPKRSAGYHAEPEMDLIDLFVGSEGTLGVVTELEVGLLPAPPRLAGWATFPGEALALEATRLLREEARRTWAGDARGVDVAAIESLDRRCLELLREDGRTASIRWAFPRTRGRPSSSRSSWRREPTPGRSWTTSAAWRRTWATRHYCGCCACCARARVSTASSWRSPATSAGVPSSWPCARPFPWP